MEPEHFNRNICQTDEMFMHLMHDINNVVSRSKVIKVQRIMTAAWLTLKLKIRSNLIKQSNLIYCKLSEARQTGHADPSAKWVLFSVKLEFGCYYG